MFGKNPSHPPHSPSSHMLLADANRSCPVGGESHSNEPALSQRLMTLAPREGVARIESLGVPNRHASLPSAGPSRCKTPLIVFNTSIVPPGYRRLPPASSCTCRGKALRPTRPHP